ncbi:hypothetical protein [Paenibacillus pedocola]|uniref:hypothetical protein n=1 Tax=Paenibacillus pedocola TaxID=3242193 RepID=UPI002877496A|nr:hypothetical protein [Paenibacillus typhae]
MAGRRIDEPVEAGLLEPGGNQGAAGSRHWQVHGIGSARSARELPEYRTLQIDTMGADEAGRLAVNHKLGGLIDQCLAYGAQQGYVNLSFIIGSRGLSCHGRELSLVSEELQKLHAQDRPEYVWLTQTGFRPSGIYPQIYGEYYHGILLIRTI